MNQNVKIKNPNNFKQFMKYNKLIVKIMFFLVIFGWF